MTDCAILALPEPSTFMAVEVKRKKGESVESLLRRFRQRVMQSGVQYRAKEVRYRTKPNSPQKQKDSALRKIKIKGKREYLQRIGKLPLDDQKSYSGKRTSVIK